MEEERAKQLLSVLAEQVGWSKEEHAEYQTDLTESFLTLYGAFEEAAKNPESLSEIGYEGAWIEPFIEIAVKNIIPDTVEIRGKVYTKCGPQKGLK